MNEPVEWHSGVYFLKLALHGAKHAQQWLKKGRYDLALHELTVGFQHYGEALGVWPPDVMRPSRNRVYTQLVLARREFTDLAIDLLTDPDPEKTTARLVWTKMMEDRR